MRLAEEEAFEYADVDHLGHYREDQTYDQKHIDLVKNLKLVDVEAIRKAHFRVAIDTVNSVGGIILPRLLEQLGVEQVTGLFTEPTGDFGHNPEPLEKNLGDIKALMQKGGHDLAFVVDPDVDRLAMFCEDGTMYGEEYTLVTVADYVLQHTPGNTVSNLSSTRALRDVTRMRGGEYSAAAVGEVNVVAKMKETNTVIGGEGNGGVIYPESHYGRDALVGVGLFLSHFVAEGKSMTALKATYPQYFISKNKLTLSPDMDVDKILEGLKKKYAYEGKAIKGNETVKDGKEVLDSGKDYKASYQNNKNLGKATITIKGIGNYKGTKKVSYTIVKRSVRSVTCHYKKTKSYTGRWVKPNVTLKVGKVKLEKNRDYTLVYRNNLQIGKASVVIQGMGNFTGKKTISFKIVPQTPKIQKLKKNKKSFAITYSSGKMVHGYQMEVSTASSFAAKKTQKYILNGNRFEAYGLKKGTYYIRVKAYYSKKGKRYESGYTSKRKIKIKK